MKSYIEGLNGVNYILDTKAEAGAKIENKSHFNNSAIQRLFTHFKAVEKDKKYEYNSTVQNYHPDDYKPSTMMEAYINFDKEEIVRKVSYEPKTLIDDSLAGNWRSKNAQKFRGLQRLLEKHGDIYSAVDTMKYLARGQFTTLNKEEDELLSKWQERRCTRLENTEKRQSSVLYGSRDDYAQRDSGFWLFDKSEHLPERILDEYRYLPMPRLDNNRENILSYSNVEEKTKKTDSCYDCMEKDSLDDCTLLEQRRESNTTTFSSSSAENLIHQWLGFLDGKDDINRDISRGRRLVSSKPSLDIARHVRAEIAKDRISDNAKKSMRELRTHDSDVLAQLSPEIRRKICHLIQKIILSDSARHSVFYHEKCLMTDMLNNEKLLHSKSVDAAFVHSNKYLKVDNEITNICTDDCFPTKSSELPEDKNCLFRVQDNFANMWRQNSDKSKCSIKIPHENITTPVSFDKSRKIGITDNSVKEIAREIIYKDESLKSIVGKGGGCTATEILSIYRKILENSNDMDWESFRKLIEILHPDQKELWHDICRTISEEAMKVVGDANGNTEVCIEISLVNPEGALKTGEVMACTREIVFELDMTLKDVESFLNKRLQSADDERLDTHRDTDKDIADWKNNGQETISKQSR